MEEKVFSFLARNNLLTRQIDDEKLLELQAEKDRERKMKPAEVSSAEEHEIEDIADMKTLGEENAEGMEIVSDEE